MITQDIEKRVLERLSLADEVSKYGVIVDNPGDEVWPFKAECTIPRKKKITGGDYEDYEEKVTVLLSKSKKAFLIDDGNILHSGDAFEFVYQARIWRRDPWCKWTRPDDLYGCCRLIATERHWNVWED